MDKIKIYINEDVVWAEFDKTNELIRQLVEVQHTLKKIEYALQSGESKKKIYGDINKAYNHVEQTKTLLHKSYIDRLQ